MVKDNRLTSGVSNPLMRENRADSDRPNKQNRETQDKLRVEERLARLIDVDTVLPNPPEIPGYHTIWLSTTNNNDSMDRRISLGYEIVSPDEVPGFSFPTQKSSTVATDRIQISEMVLCKIDTELYDAYMVHNHHDRPLEEETRIKPDITRIKDRRGGTIGIIEGDGFGELGKSVAPKFN